MILHKAYSISCYVLGCSWIHNPIKRWMNNHLAYSCYHNPQFIILVLINSQFIVDIILRCYFIVQLRRFFQESNFSLKAFHISLVWHQINLSSYYACWLACKACATIFLASILMGLNISIGLIGIPLLGFIHWLC